VEKTVHKHSAAIMQIKPLRQQNGPERETEQQTSATDVALLVAAVTEDLGLSALPALQSGPYNNLSHVDGAGMNMELPTLSMSNYELRKAADVLFVEGLKRVVL